MFKAMNAAPTTISPTPEISPLGHTSPLCPRHEILPKGPQGQKRQADLVEHHCR